MRMPSIALACCLAFTANTSHAATVGVSVLGNPFVFFEVRTEPNGDVRSQRLDLISCDGSVRVAIEACDGSVRDIESIAIDVSATRNPGSNVGVQVTGQSESYAISVIFGNFAPGLEGPLDLTLRGQYEIERLRAPDLYGNGRISIEPLETYLLLPSHLTGGLFGDDLAIRHGTGVYALEPFAGDQPTFEEIEVSGPLLTGLDEIVLSQASCLLGQCENVGTLVSMFVDNPGGAFRRARVAAQMTWEPGEITPIPLPAAGWLLVAALGAAGMVSRRRSV